MDTPKSTDFAAHVGIDVSKDKLDLYLWPEGKHFTIKNSLSAIEQLLDSFKSQDRLVAFEATGGYDLVLWQCLSAADLPFVRLHATHVRHFAKSTGKLAKTDRVDAQIIAEYVARLSVDLSPPLSQQLHEIKQFVAQRNHLIEARKKERTRRQQITVPELQALGDHLIEQMSLQIDQLDKAIARRIKQDPILAKRADRLRTMKGIGWVNVIHLVALMPELGLVNSKQIAALAGLAPIARDSGAYRGRRMIGGGRKPVRSALWMAAIVAIKHDPRWHQFYQRLVQAGKPFKLAITAVCRKMLITLNAMIRDEKDYSMT